LKSLASSPTKGIFLLAGLAAFLSPAPGTAQPGPATLPTQPMTAQQVSCSGDQIRAILGRSAVIFGPAYDDRTGMFLFTYASPSRDLSGLAVLEQTDRWGETQGPERQLAFMLTPGRDTLQRSPQRQQLSPIYLMRDPLATDLVTMKDPGAMAVLVDPTADPQHNDNADSLIMTDNLTAAEGSTPGGAQGGRVLTRLLEQCANQYTAADLHVFSVVSRLLRATAYTTTKSDPNAERVHKLAAVYRGEEAVPISGGVRTTYRIDLYPTLTAPLHRVSMELKVDLGLDGSLGDATLRVLPACAADGDRGCTSATDEVDVEIIQPVASQRLWNGPSPGVCWKGDASCPTEVSFSFAERLQGTTWRQP
jgi:hypothetical protein